MKVIIVEDEPAVANLYEGLLKNLASEVHVAHDLPELHELLKQFVPDVVVMDLRLKTSGPKESLAQIKPIKVLNPDAVVIVATGMSGTDIEKEAKEAGADYFAVKPETNTAEGMLSAILMGCKGKTKSTRAVEFVERLTEAMTNSVGGTASDVSNSA